MRNFLKDSRAGWTYDKYKSEIERLGATLGSTSGEEGLSRVHAAEVKRLLSAMHGDIEAGNVSVVRRPAVPPQRVYQNGRWVDIPGRQARYGGGPATQQTLETAELYAKARKLARREHAINELGDMVTKSRTPVGDQYVSWNTNRILKTIDRKIEAAANPRAPGHKRAARFVGSWEPGELLGLRQKFEEIGQGVPAIPVKKGGAHGSGGYVVRAMLGELGGLTVGHGPLGRVAGILAPEATARVVMTPWGRGVVKRAARANPNVSPFQQYLLGTATRANSPQGQGAQ